MRIPLPIWLIVTALAIVAASAAGVARQSEPQQIADPDFRPAVERPA